MSLTPRFDAKASTETALAKGWRQRRRASVRASRRATGSRVGRLFAGRFRLTRVLGAGGMGVVYAAHDEHGRRSVAIKLIRTGAVKRSNRAARLRREGRLAQRLEHPSIVQTLGGGEFGGEPYVILEHVPGARTLHELQPALTLFDKVRVIRDAALALGHAHARGVVHRDVKPENLLLDAEGEVRLVDFGLAITPDSDRITDEGSCLGTPLYVAPETIAEGRYGPRADVWALGVTLYWLLTARYPFEAAGVAELCQQILTTRPVSPRRFDPELPPRVVRACLRALERDPARRYPDATALADDLDRWLLGAWSRRCRTLGRDPGRPAELAKLGVLGLAGAALLSAVVALIGVALRGG